MKNVYVISDKTHKPQTVTHKTFDEAHMTSHNTTLPPMAQALQRAGYDNSHTTGKDTPLLPESSH